MSLTFRSLGNENRSDIRALYARLDAECLRSRFGLALTSAALDAYVHRINFSSALIIGAFDGDQLVGLCEAYPHEADEPLMEAAFTVDPAYQGKHIGRQLGAKLKAATEASLIIVCVSNNPAMAKMAASLGFERLSAQNTLGLSLAVINDMHTHHGLWGYRPGRNLGRASA